MRDAVNKRPRRSARTDRGAKSGTPSSGTLSDVDYMRRPGQNISLRQAAALTTATAVQQQAGVQQQQALAIMSSSDEPSRLCRLNAS